MSREGIVPPPVPGPPVPLPHVVAAPPVITPPPGPPAPPPLIPNLEPISVTMTVDAHDVIDATVGQVESTLKSTGSTLMSAAIQEAFVLLDPLLQKYMDQLLAALPGLLANAVKHLLVKEDPPTTATDSIPASHQPWPMD